MRSLGICSCGLNVIYYMLQSLHCFLIFWIHFYFHCMALGFEPSGLCILHNFVFNLKIYFCHIVCCQSGASPCYSRNSMVNSSFMYTKLIRFSQKMVTGVNIDLKEAITISDLTWIWTHNHWVYMQAFYHLRFCFTPPLFNVFYRYIFFNAQF